MTRKRQRVAARSAPPAERASATTPPTSTRARLGRAAPIAAIAVVVAIGLRDRGADTVARATPPVVATGSSPSPDAPPPPDAAPAPTNHLIGSAKCGECHDKELAAWKKSWHARALAPANRKSLAGDFGNAHFAGTSSEAWMGKRDNAYVMKTRGPDGSLAEFIVDWVIGGKRMQDNVTVFPDGRWQVLPVYFHVTGRAWVDYTETKQGQLTPEHPFYWTNARRMANHECLDCHTTGLRVDYDEPTHKWTTTFVDPNVACEDCHGAGERHADTQEGADIVHPAHAKDVALAACARCHGPRNPLFPLLDAEHQYRIGDSYDEMYDPIVVVLPQQGTSSDFFVDGRPKTSSFEYQAMLQSACYRKGGATCLTCHTAPHEAKEHAELRDKDPDASCKRCHAKIAADHSHHKAAAARRCIACHMPPVVSGVLDHFVDHAIDIPVPENTARHGIPSACGVCHADRSADDLARALLAWWPDAAARQARRLRLAGAFDESTAKASARPLADVIRDTSEAPTLRGAAAILVARRFGPPTAPALRMLVDSSDVLLRAKGCEALGAAHATASADAVALHLDDRSLRVRLACALALHDMRDARGEPALKRLADDPASSHLAVPHLELGSLYARRGDFVAARRELTAVAHLMPYYTDALIQLAAVTAELGDFTAARARIDQALALEPAHRGALALRAKLPP